MLVVMPCLSCERIYLFNILWIGQLEMFGKICTLQESTIFCLPLATSACSPSDLRLQVPRSAGSEVCCKEYSSLLGTVSSQPPCGRNRLLPALIRFPVAVNVQDSA